MTIFTTLMLGLVFCSILLCAIAANRVIAYNKKYKLPETNFTRLFRVFTKEHITLFYIAAILVHAAFTIWLAFSI